MEKAKMMTVYMTDGVAICVFIFAFIGVVNFMSGMWTFIKWIGR